MNQTATALPEQEAPRTIPHLLGQAKVILEELRAAGFDPDEDPDTLEMLQSECDAPERMRRLARAFLARKRDAEQLKERIDALEKRRKGLIAQQTSIKALLVMMLKALDMTKLPKSPDFSGSLRDGRPAVLITDESKVPGAFWVTKREIDTSALNEALQAGPVAGAALSVPAPVLSIRG